MRISLAAVVGVAMLVFAATGFCIMANSLYWMGVEPRLVREQCTVDAPEPHGVPVGV